MKKYLRWRPASADISKKSRQLLAATLMIGGAWSIVLPVLADGTKAGTQIDNRATATYGDGTTGTTYNATSNTVTIKVAEVAGITLTAQSPSKLSPNAGDTLYVDFVITNVGNDPTRFFIPGVAKLSNATSFSQNGKLQIVEVNGTALGTAIDVPTNGDNTGNLLSSDATKGSFAPSETLKVRVPIKVNNTALKNDKTTVSLGDTNPTDAQNVDFVSGTNDVYTVDNPDPSTITDEVPGAPAIEREAMATSAEITVNSRLQAFATILKAVASYSNNNTPGILSDDTLKYSLALRVENPTSVTSGLTVSDLYGTDITFDTGTETKILISDAVPTNTVLSATDPPAAPSGWEVVYTTTPLTTFAHKATWSRTRPSGTITRVGFVKTGPIARGTLVSGFNISVTPTASFKGGQIANIAQVFGQSMPGTVAAETPTQLVYDESGDQAPNNQLDGSNPDPTSGGAPSTGLGIDTGVADPSKDQTDPGKGTDPTATGSTNLGSPSDADGGEDTVFSIAATPLNGPENAPDAIGPTDNNDDFTNQSIVLPSGVDPATPLTDSQTLEASFKNTVQNTSASAQTISLLPVAPTKASDLPNGTKVTIDNGTDNAVYQYNGTQFVFQSGSTGISPTSPVKLTNLAPSGTGGGADRQTYTVKVDLPDVDQLKGYPVPIVAFIDENNNGVIDNEPSNTTLDRLYTGYVSLLKEARILEADGTTQVAPFSSKQADLSSFARPGRIIEYRITYQNLSTSQTGSATGNKTLPATNLTITENGSVSPNNWFGVTQDPTGGTIPGSAIDVKGVITGTSTNNDIEIYVDTITKLDPQNSGTFTFRRKIK